MYGIRITEFGAGGAAIAPIATGEDGTPPRVLSPDTGVAGVGQAYAIELEADEDVRWTIRAGADGDLFDLDGARLSLPLQGRPGAPAILVCNLRAIDARGNRTSFAHAVVLQLDPEPVAAGGLLFDDPDQSGLIAVL